MKKRIFAFRLLWSSIQASGVRACRKSYDKNASASPTLRPLRELHIDEAYDEVSVDLYELQLEIR